MTEWYINTAEIHADKGEEVEYLREMRRDLLACMGGDDITYELRSFDVTEIDGEYIVKITFLTKEQHVAEFFKEWAHYEVYRDGGETLTVGASTAGIPFKIVDADLMGAPIDEQLAGVPVKSLLPYQQMQHSWVVDHAPVDGDKQ